MPNPRDPQSLNRYSYVENNPLKYIDPTGHFKFGTFLGRAFHGIDKTLQNNSWLRIASWVILPGYTMNIDPRTRTQVWAAGTAAATGGMLGIGAGGFQGFFAATAAGAASGASQAALTDSNMLRGTAGGIASAMISGGFANSGIPFGGMLGGIAGSAASAAIRGKDPGQAALMALGGAGVGVAIGLTGYIGTQINEYSLTPAEIAASMQHHFNAIAGVNAGGYAGTGAEVSSFVFANPQEGMIGLGAQAGAGTGLNIGAGGFLGFQLGGTENLVSPNYNYNFSLGPLSVTFSYSLDGSFSGANVGIGSGRPPFGFSTSVSSGVIGGHQSLEGWSAK